MRKTLVNSGLLIAIVLSGSACGSDKVASAPTAKVKVNTLTVLAASSLTKAFTALATEFEAAHPGTNVQLSFGSSTDLERQVEQGAAADVFASADQKNMNKLVKSGGNLGAPVNFARNKLTIAVAKGNPKHIANMQSLTASGLVVVLCDAAVPCGKFADQVLGNAAVKLTPKSREPSVRATLNKVELGEADAAIVYASDVATSRKVDAVAIPDAINVVTDLPIATLKGSKNVAVAQLWVTFVSAHEADLVQRFGFVAR